MARTPSNMIPLGTKAPHFELVDTKDNILKSLSSLKGEKATVIMFICNHCPFVIHVNPEISKLAKDYVDQGVNCIAISSNDIENYPQDRPELMRQVAAREDYIFPYLFDKDQKIAKSYDAACTPDFYLFNSDLELVYRGQLDSSRPENNKPLNGKDLRNAIDATIKNQKASDIQFPSIGCNIKWKN